MTFYEIDKEDEELIKIALSKLESNFDDKKYNHTVGTAIRCKNGNVYSGVNCDGIHGSCAEYITMGIAISAGEREFDTKENYGKENGKASRTGEKGCVQKRSPLRGSET